MKYKLAFSLVTLSISSISSANKLSNHVTVNNEDGNSIFEFESNNQIECRNQLEKTLDLIFDNNATAICRTSIASSQTQSLGYSLAVGNVVQIYNKEDFSFNASNKKDQVSNCIEQFARDLDDAIHSPYFGRKGDFSPIHSVDGLCAGTPQMSGSRLYGAPYNFKVQIRSK